MVGLGVRGALIRRTHDFCTCLLTNQDRGFSSRWYEINTSRPHQADHVQVRSLYRLREQKGFGFFLLSQNFSLFTLGTNLQREKSFKVFQM